MSVDEMPLASIEAILNSKKPLFRHLYTLRHSPLLSSDLRLRAKARWLERLSEWCEENGGDFEVLSQTVDEMVLLVVEPEAVHHW